MSFHRPDNQEQYVQDAIQLLYEAYNINTDVDNFEDALKEIFEACEEENVAKGMFAVFKCAHCGANATYSSQRVISLINGWIEYVGECDECDEEHDLSSLHYLNM